MKVRELFIGKRGVDAERYAAFFRRVGEREVVRHRWVAVCDFGYLPVIGHTVRFSGEAVSPCRMSGERGVSMAGNTLRYVTKLATILWRKKT